MKETKLTTSTTRHDVTPPRAATNGGVMPGSNMGRSQFASLTPRLASDTVQLSAPATQPQPQFGLKKWLLAPFFPLLLAACGKDSIVSGPEIPDHVGGEPTTQKYQPLLDYEQGGRPFSWENPSIGKIFSSTIVKNGYSPQTDGSLEAQPEITSEDFINNTVSSLRANGMSDEVIDEIENYLTPGTSENTLFLASFPGNNDFASRNAFLTIGGLNEKADWNLVRDLIDTGKLRFYSDTEAASIYPNQTALLQNSNNGNGGSLINFKTPDGLRVIIANYQDRDFETVTPIVANTVIMNEVFQSFSTQPAGVDDPDTAEELGLAIQYGDHILELPETAGNDPSDLGVTANNIGGYVFANGYTPPASGTWIKHPEANKAPSNFQPTFPNLIELGTPGNDSTSIALDPRQIKYIGEKGYELVDSDQTSDANTAAVIDQALNIPNRAGEEKLKGLDRLVTGQTNN